MFDLSKKFALLLIFVLVMSSLFLVEFCVAPVTVPANPSAAPEIVSVEIHNDPIWYPPTYSVPDPYTGEVTQTRPGYWGSNGSIILTIKNRPFTPYTDKDGNNINIYYSVFTMLSFVGSWDKSPWPVIYQSDSVNTIITLTYGNGGTLYVEPEEIVNFRVQAVAGYFRSSYETRDLSSVLPFLYTVPAVYEGVGSSYAEFTITIPTTDESGTLKPNIQPSSVVPSTSSSDSSAPLTPNTTSSSDTTSTSNPYNPPSQQTPWTSNILIIVLASVCLVTIPIATLAYQYGKRKTGSAQTNPSTTT